ncbi:MAG: glycosyltransferase [Calditrichae bacterium]|nr:glycosyltransferase [Calditrichota bacterium]MCB9058844.1 glycosyltransferase [Calditrichia bacterium]
MDNLQWVTPISMALAMGYFFLVMYLLNHPKPKKKIINNWPAISLLVPFRNEEENLDACCQALRQLDYPGKLQILLLNDGSSDASVTIVESYLKDTANFSLIHIEKEIEGLRGKMNVLAHGIKMAEGEYIFVTDADCQPHRNWLKTTMEYFDEKTALVSGFTVLKLRNNDKQKLFEKLQIIDWIFLQGLASSASNAGKPITVIGNNLAFKKSVYDQLGGFENVGFSVTEDHALMQAILDKTDFDVKYINDSAGPVYSYPVNRFNDFVQQRQRWIKGGLKGRPFAFFLVGFSYIAHLIIPLIFISGPYNMLTATAIGLIVGIDYFQLKRNLKTFNLENYKSEFIKYEVFYLLYSSFLFLMLPFPKKVKWKGRQY